MPRNSNYSRISSLYRHGQVYLTRALESYEISSGAHMLIRAVCENPGISQEELAKMLQMNKATIARAVKQLESDGIITREAGTDKKTKKVMPAKKAHDFYAAIVQAQKDLDSIILSNMNESEKLLFVSLLKRSSENIVSRVKSNAAARRKSFD